MEVFGLWFLEFKHYQEVKATTLMKVNSARLCGQQRLSADSNLNSVHVCCKTAAVLAFSVLAFFQSFSWMSWFLQEALCYSALQQLKALCP